MADSSHIDNKEQIIDSDNHASMLDIKMWSSFFGGSTSLGYGTMATMHGLNGLNLYPDSPAFHKLTGSGLGGLALGIGLITLSYKYASKADSIAGKI